MKILSCSIDTTTTETRTIGCDGEKYVLIDTFNSAGKVIDSQLRDEDGNEVCDAALLEEIQNFVDKSEREQLNMVIASVQE